MDVKHFSSLAIFAILICASCSMQEEQLIDGLDETKASSKILKISENYLPNTFSVKFNTVPTEEELKQFCAEGVEEIVPVFQSYPGNEELEAKFGLDRWYQVTLEDGASLDGNVLRFARMPEVSIAQYSEVMEKSYTGETYAVEETKAEGTYPFNDPYLSYQWGLRNTGGANIANNAVKGADINVFDVWNALEIYGDPDIIVAVVDEGVWYSHPDLQANMWTNPAEIPGNGIDDDGDGYVDDVYGYNFVDHGPISWDKSGDTGHGTHCAGVIAAENNNAIGISGIAGGSGKHDACKIMSCQIFSGNAGGSATVSSRAIKYAADHGASIISCSFGVSSQIPTDNSFIRNNSIEIDAINYFEAKKNNPVLDGGVVIFAAGNESHPFAHYPGALADIISVSAVAPDLLPAEYTNYGPGCNIAAPGGELGRVNSFRSMILSTVTEETEQLGYSDNSSPVGTGYKYGYMNGTSMACPHVSGVAALALSYAKRLGKTFTCDEFKNILLASTQDMDQRIGKVSSKSYVDVSISYYGKTGYRYSAKPDLMLAPYFHQMGTGLIDAWQVMMNIEGLRSLTAAVGSKNYIDLSDYFGSSSVSLTYLDVEVPQATKDAMGLKEIEATNTSKYPAYPEKGYAYVQFGRLYLHPTKVGSGKIIIHAVGGGDHLGGGDNPTGGMEIVQEVSVISRDVASTNGGWL